MADLHKIYVGKKAANLDAAFLELRQRFAVSHIEERDACYIVHLYDGNMCSKAIFFLESEGLEIL